MSDLKKIDGKEFESESKFLTNAISLTTLLALMMSMIIILVSGIVLGAIKMIGTIF